MEDDEMLELASQIEAFLHGVKHYKCIAILDMVRMNILLDDIIVPRIKEVFSGDS